VRVAVIGAGIAGLAAAFELQQQGASPVVFDSDVRIGGKLRTEPFADVLLDTGPDSFLARRPEAVELCRELGIDATLVPPSATSAFVYARGALRRLPAGLVLGVPTDPLALARSGILSGWGAVRAAVEPLLPGAPLAGDTALGGLTRRRFGNEVTARLVDPLLGGINAGDVDQLSIDTVAPQIAAAARRHRSLTRALRSAPQPPTTGDPVFLTIPGGMEALVDALAARLPDIRRADPVSAVSATRVTSRSGDHDVDGVVLATPGFVTGPLLKPHAPGAASIVGSIPYASVTMVLLAYPESAMPRPLDASGFLVPRSQDLLMTAASWASSKWSHLARPGRVLLRVSAGKHGDDRAMRLDDADLVERIRADLHTTMGVTGAPTAVRVVRWPRSFPQYLPGHQARIARATGELAERAPWLAVAGAALNGVGIPACIGSGRAAARSLLALAG
jgi:oxygen-dependent protoporphyrinogen oxidase